MDQSKTSTYKTIFPNTNDRTDPAKPDPGSIFPAGDFLTNQNAAAAVKTPKVQFGAAAPVGERGNIGSGSGRDFRSGKRSFKDIVLQDVIRTNQKRERSRLSTALSAAASPKKGILKLRGESNDSEKQSLCFVNQAYVGDDDIGLGDDALCAPPPSSVSVTSRSAFLFERRRSSEHGFAGVVELLFQRGSLDFGKRDTHPFGRDSSVEAILEGKSAPKRQSLISGYSKLVLWITLLSFLVGAAFGLIFLSETYNAKHRHDYLLKAGMNETQNMTS